MKKLKALLIAVTFFTMGLFAEDVTVILQNSNSYNGTSDTYLEKETGANGLNDFIYVQYEECEG